MSKKNQRFPDPVKIKAMLCCDRHCCLCGKQCSTHIEIHHIEPIDKGGKNTFDNAIPLCYECHAKVAMYNDRHPKGSKYRKKELIERRNQIYDKYTSPYVPPVEFKIISKQNQDGKFSIETSRFQITNLHSYLKCEAKVIQSIYCKINNEKEPLKDYKNGNYGGGNLWRLNPRTTVDCPRNIKKILGDKFPTNYQNFQVEIEVILIDKFGWEHRLYPVSWIFAEDTGWFYEPFEVHKD